MRVPMRVQERIPAIRPLVTLAVVVLCFAAIVAPKPALAAGGTSSSLAASEYNALLYEDGTLVLQEGFDSDPNRGTLVETYEGLFADQNRSTLSKLIGDSGRGNVIKMVIADPMTLPENARAFFRELCIASKH